MIIITIKSKSETRMLCTHGGIVVQIDISYRLQGIEVFELKSNTI